MKPDFTPYFAPYEALAAEADTLFTRVAHQHPHCVRCQPGCADCCHALFDLSLIEALYLHEQFCATFDFGPERSRILAAAADTDRALTRFKRQLYLDLKEAGQNADFSEHDADRAVAKVMDRAARERIRCPLLGPDDRCVLYEARPVTCRLYGIPTAIQGQGHVCGKAAFEPGKGYPTVHLDKIQDRLSDLSLALQEGLHSRFKDLHKVYVPVSMALLTNYDAAYLGLKAGEPA